MLKKRIGSFLKVVSGIVYRLFQLFKLFKLCTWALDTYCHSIQYIHFRTITSFVSDRIRDRKHAEDEQDGKTSPVSRVKYFRLSSFNFPRDISFQLPW